MTVFSGAERRRDWSDAEKINIVTRAFAPNAVVSRVAREADVHPSQIYRWRAHFGLRVDEEKSEFARVVVDEDALQRAGGSAITVRLAGVLVEIAAHAPGALVTATLRALAG